MEREEQRDSTDAVGRDRAHLRIGAYVLAVLLVLTAVEYAIALVMTTKNLPVMIVMNLADAAIIMYFFMHIARAFRGSH